MLPVESHRVEDQIEADFQIFLRLWHNFTMVGFSDRSQVLTIKVARKVKWLNISSDLGVSVPPFTAKVRHAYMSIKPFLSSSKYYLSLGLSNIKEDVT
jgi:hypothetical protein